MFMRHVPVAAPLREVENLSRPTAGGLKDVRPSTDRDPVLRKNSLGFSCAYHSRSCPVESLYS